MKAWLVAFIAIYICTVFGAKQPYLPPEGLLSTVHFFFAATLTGLFIYFAFVYRQKDQHWHYGWKLIRKETLKFKASFVLALPITIALGGYILTMPAEVAFGVAANLLNTKPALQTGKCITSYRNRLRGPVTEVELKTGQIVKLHGFDYICGNRAGAPIENAASSVRLIGRQSRIGIWIDDVTPIR